MTGLVLFVALFAAWAMWPDLFEGTSFPVWMRALARGSHALVAMTVAMAIIEQAMTVKRTTATVMALSRATFSIYLFHYPILLVVLAVFPGKDAAHFAFAVGVTLMVSIACHFLVVERSEWAAFLINGRKMPRRSSPAQGVA